MKAQIKILTLIAIITFAGLSPVSAEPSFPNHCEGIELYDRSILTFDYDKMNKKEIQFLLATLSTSYELTPSLLGSYSFSLSFSDKVSGDLAISRALFSLCTLLSIPSVKVTPDTPVPPIGRLSASN